jgi:pimeloyl-ACP methyl ester carboxylesterase
MAKQTGENQVDMRTGLLLGEDGSGDKKNLADHEEDLRMRLLEDNGNRSPAHLAVNGEKPREGSRISMPEGVVFGTIRRSDGRFVTYGIVGEAKEGAASAPLLSPVLCFYPLNGNRRVLLMLREAAISCHLRIISVNRPSTGGTSVVPYRWTATCCVSGDATLFMATVVEDAVRVLDALGIQRVSLLALCAGAPHALAFASRHPERTTGRFMSIAGWIQPADCQAKATRLLYRLGASPCCQMWFAAPVVATIASLTGPTMTRLFPSGWVVPTLRIPLSTQEREYFDRQFPEGRKRGQHELVRKLKWMREEGTSGASAEVSVLFASSAELGIDYDVISGSQTMIYIWHGTRDTHVPYSSAQWLADRLLPTSTLNTLEDGSHQGALFLLYPKMANSLRLLGTPQES